ncbi:ATP-dependent helicase [Streptomyces alfalfae]|uniref:Helicase n=1 Tax=Streptomyces alfalfae TaxID=1642299 RepID=A0ABM6GXS5_9ACTN|nr:DEAD/DEAH box helicase [Streptomyces alfalfae]APY88855.1 helicase [Streptomyces alfalfae]AYA19274.1 DEAD/DEAH box helicase [Streptomyces fradiae]RXX36099.1 ATP-dependent helicase [Streptomyces alfalfae]RZN03891.1 DEAD/DEAH box helicase [Streptomyces alfalfae]
MAVTVEAATAGHASVVRSCAAVFLPAEAPREGRIAFWRADGGDLPGSGEPADGFGPGEAWTGDRGEIVVARRHGKGARARTVPALFLPVAEAVPLLLRAARPHPAAACWGAAARHALHLAARGRLLPGVTTGDVDAWRAGPLDESDVAQLRAIAAALPAEAHAVPLPGAGPLLLPEQFALVRAFVDAVVDALPRSPAAAHAVGAPFAAREPQRLPGARGWAAEVAAGVDAGVRVSLRLDLRAHEVFDGADAEGPDQGGGEADRAAGAGVSRAAVASPAAAVVQVHSLADPSLVTDVPRLWAGADHFGPRATVDTLLAVRRAARVWPPLARLLERPVPDVLPLSEEELYDLLGAAAGRLGAAGVTVHWPRELTRGLTATAVVRPAPGTAADNFDFFKTEELLEFRWQIALGDQAGEPLTEAELDLLAEAHRPVVRLRDQWVVVDPDLVRKARKRDLGLLDPVDALSVALTGTAEVDGEQVPAVPVGALAGLRERVTGDLGTVAQPPGLHATLRDYQLRGLAWLDRMTSLGLGGCLADDMGLGKTVTLIALHLHRAHPAPTLVVCPASLLGNWQREIERFAPGVPVRRFHGQGRTLADLTGGFVLTTYATMRTSAADLAARPWGLVVADEAQHVKNPHAATAKALRTIPSPARVALTGTPVENNLSELWALLDWTTPGLLGPLKAFRARHARLVEGGENAENDEAMVRLARLVRPFLLRRKKSDPGIAPELPPKTETDHPVTLTREQASLYEAVVRETLARIEASKGIARRGLVMKLLMALKQICNHPAQYLKDGALSTRSGRPRSGKLELLDELLDTILTESESAGAVLIFTQYVEMARLLEAHLSTRGVGTQLLHGGTPVARREEMVDRFQSGEVPVFLLSLKAAGTGLNLTRAGHVIHYDRWWNPAVEEQATDRAYRIGQTRPVQVHRLITEGTVEDRIAELLAAKQALADAVLGDGGEAALTELSDAELADLVALRRTA